MAKLDLRTAPRDEKGLVAVEQGSGNETSHYRIDSIGSHKLPPPPRDVRREIWLFVYGSDRAVTRAEIAKQLGYKKTPWLNGIIERMVKDGFLVCYEARWKNGVPMFYYTINE